MTFCGLDVGTTCCKGVLFDERGEILTSASFDNELLIEGGDSYIHVDRVRENVGRVLSAISSKYPIGVVAVSSLGESFVSLDRDDKILYRPMLYTDLRGCEEADEYRQSEDMDALFRTTGTLPHGMYSFYKLLWIKRHHPKIYEKISRVLLIEDYVGYLLTGERMMDFALASRTGMLNVAKRELDEKMLGTLGLDRSVFSKPVPSGTMIGKILPSFAAEFGINPECRVAVGAHDQVASALGAGATGHGVGVDGMGTVECITAIFPEQVTDLQMGREGYPCVPFPGGNFCTYLLNYTGGALFTWYRDFLSVQGKLPSKDFYAKFEDPIDTNRPTDLLVLPYFRGAATPYQNEYATGAIVGLGTNTTAGEVYQAIIEGVSYEMRLNLETMAGHGQKIDRLICTGGGSKSDKWLQIKANILNLPVSRVSTSEGGACGCAILGAVATGFCPDIESASKIFSRPGKTFTPHPNDAYERRYERYLQLYRNLKPLFTKG